MLLFHEILKFHLIFPTACERILVVSYIGFLDHWGKKIGFSPSGALIVLCHNSHFVLFIWAAQVQARWVVKVAAKI
jgi:hypothetical protein